MSDEPAGRKLNINEDWLAVIVGSGAPRTGARRRDPGQRDPVTEQTTERTPEKATSFGIGYAVAGVLAVIALGAASRFLEQQVPSWAAGTPLAKVAKSIEFPIYAIALGLIGNVVLSKLALRDALSRGFRTEFFIKTGLVLLGASINLSVLVTAAGPAVIQALLLISIVFGFTWWLGGRLGLEDKLRALLASAVSICGVSAAILPRARCRPSVNNSPMPHRW